MRKATTEAVLADLRKAVGDENILTGSDEVMRVIKDNSWLSPILAQDLDRRREIEGPTLGVLAVATPTSEQAVVALAEAAVRYRVPVTPRGSGTSNFGLVTPTAGGLILDLRSLRSEARLEGDGITAGAGTTPAVMERTARREGRELTVLTTTYVSATVGGWVAGGHVGLGSSVFGSVWDDNVVAARIVTFSDRPEVRSLRGPELIPIFHTFGVAGVLTEVTFRTDRAHGWQEAIASFKTFEAASEFVQAISVDRTFRHRAVTAQERELMPAFRALDLPARADNQPGVLMIIDQDQTDSVRTLADSFGGTVALWQKWEPKPSDKPSIASMVYGHRMLWVKKLFPQAAFIHMYFDPKSPRVHADAIKARFGEQVLLEMKFIRSPRMLGVLGFDTSDTLPAAVATVVQGEDPEILGQVMEFCADEGIQIQNSHTNVIEDSGIFPDPTPIVDFKAEIDPYGLLNPGKLRTARMVA